MTMNPENELEPIINKVLELAKEQGASEAEADIGIGSGLSATVRMRELEKIEHERDKAMHITVYMDGRKGSSSTSDFSLDSLKKSVEAACAIAAHTSVDNAAGLVEAELMATEFPDLDLYHPWDISPEAATRLAIDCEALALDADDRITNADGTMVTTYSGSHLYANSHGFCNGWNWSSHTVDCTVIAQTDNGMQRDGWYSKHRDSNCLESIENIAKEAAKRCVDRLDAKKLSTRTVPVIYEAPVASSLFSPFITAISGGSLYRQASFMLDKKGQSVFADHITLAEDPHRLKALGSAPFDNDGVATKAREIVSKGILQDYVLSGYSARKLGLQTTGNAGGVHNLTVSTTHDTLEELIALMGTGLLITDMIGFGVNQVTGDYSRGASGFWVDNGELAYPVEEITVAGNLCDIYQNIQAIASDVDPRGNILAGSVLISEMTVAGE